MKVFIENGSYEYNELFLSLGFELTDNSEESDLVCFTGGSDVSPHFYGERHHPTTWNDVNRDVQGQHIIQVALKLGIPMVGICRGGQFLNVMNGGKLYQDVDGHATGRPHNLIDELTSEQYSVTSTHHQMMSHGPKGLIVAHAKESSYKEYMRDDYVVRINPVQDYEEDVEVVWYEDTKCLCFQPHPEFTGNESADSTKLYFKILLERYFNIN